MDFRSSRTILGIAAALTLAAVIGWIFHSPSIPEFHVNAVPKNAPELNEADIEKLLGVDQFRVLRRVRQVPVAVRESFSNFTGIPFDLVDPGEQIRHDDLTVRAKSSRRLVFLGLSEDSAVLVYQQGGFADACNVAVFWFGEGGQGWRATLDSTPRDIPGLRGIVQKREFHILGRNE